MKQHLISKEILAEMFDSDELRPATEFPFKIDEHYAIEIEKSGQGHFLITPRRRSPKIRSEDPDPGKERPPQRNRFAFYRGKPLRVGTHPDYPDTVFVRQEKRGLVAIYKSETVVGRINRKANL